MIKILNQYFPGRLFVLLVTENALILLGIWIALSYHLGGFGQADLSFPVLFGKVVLITAICQLCLYYSDIYDLRSITSRLDVVLRVLQALGAASLILAGIFYLVPQMRLGQGIVETSLLAVVLFILLWRVLVEWLNRAYGGGEKILLVGSGNLGLKLTEVLRTRTDLPIKLIGVVAEGAAAQYQAGAPVLAGIDRLVQTIEEQKPDRIVIALQERRQQLPWEVLLRLRTHGMLIEEASNLYQKMTGKIPVESIYPSTLIFSEGFQQSSWMRAYSRIMGLVLASVVTVLVSPVLLLLALLIKLDSRGPAIYRQTRVGRFGRPFEILKFRSMGTDAEQDSGPVWAQEKDPRVTRMGRILRKLRLDELPQLLNILKGEMSFVGPRPERPHFIDQLKHQIPFYDLRHSVRPGITGWAQVSMRYGATVEDSQEKLEYDLFYIQNLSFSFDLLILFQTVKIVMFGRGAR